MFEIPPAPGKNTVIVAQTFPKDKGPGEIPNMGTVVIKPKGKGKGYEIVSKINLQEFIEWAHPPLPRRSNSSPPTGTYDPLRAARVSDVQEFQQMMDQFPQ